MAMTVLVTGAILATESFRSSLRMRREGLQEYQAALLLEGRMLEMEKTGRADTASSLDPILGPVSWNEETRAATAPDWTEHRLTINWMDGKRAHALDLSTPADR